MKTPVEGMPLAPSTLSLLLIAPLCLIGGVAGAWLVVFATVGFSRWMFP